MRAQRFLPSVYLSCLLGMMAVWLNPAVLRAQDPAIVPRIVAPVDESRVTVLKGNTRPEARAEFDRGPVAPNLPMGDLVLVLRRSPERQAAFDAFLASQYDSSSPNFHHWLTPDQIGQQYGPAQSDIDTIKAWLQNHGFSVDSVAKDRMSIRFGGAASQVTSTFHTEIHNLQVRGEDHIANMTDPSIPEALTPVVVGVKALHNFYPHTLHKLGAEIRRNGETGKWERISAPAAVPSKALSAAPNAHEIRPLFNTGGTTSGAASIEDIGPYDFATIYNVLPLWTASTAIDGTGQKIAIAGTSDIDLTDVATFRQAFGLPVVGSTYPTYKAPVVIDTNTPPGDCSSGASSCIDDVYENTLDVEWSGAIAKNAQIILVASSSPTATSDPVYLSSQYIVEHVTAPIMNVSYGECELGLGVAGNTNYDNLWSSAESAGIAVFVSTGDEGSPSCDAGNDTNVPYGAQYGLSVSGLASTPYNTAVGGTDFNWSWSNKQATYWSATNNSTNLSSALGYIPEFPWNNTCTNPLLDAEINSELGATDSATTICNDIGTGIIYSNGGSLYGLVDIVGGSGGKSSCIDGDGATVASCTKGYTKPSWQTGVTGIPSDGVRDIPDVSFFAANGFSGSAYVVCVSVAGTCSYTAGTEPTGEEVGGTSVSSPIMAGVMALINQKTGTLQGNPNKVLYELAAKETYSGCSTETVGLSGSNCVFYDIDTGTNAMACDAGSPDCTAPSTYSYGVLSGYSSTVGYDLTTGLGSMNVANLVSAFTTEVAPALTLSSALTFAATAEGTTDPTTQSITIKNTGGGSVADITGITITGADASSFSETNTCGSTLAVGASCVVTVTFKPAAIGTLTASVSVADNVTGSPQTVGLTGTGAEVGSYSLSATAVTIAAAGSSGTSTVTATATGGYTGVITLTCSVAALAGGSDTPTCSGSTITVASGATTATGTITLGTAAGSALKTGTVRADAGQPRIRPWIGMGGAALACVLLVGIPARRRGWKTWLGVFLLMTSFGGAIVGCGGGGSSTPPASAPTVTTGAVTLITSSGASLAGTVNPNGATTSASFLYGTSTTALSSQTASQSVGSGSTASNVTATLTGLTSNTKYYYQLQATNSGGTGSGSVDSFTTASIGTTAGAYTVTVTGTDKNEVSETTTFTLTVQ
jgi:hypothetical protein